jgi:nucleotide-binding universal stress UspA family protein
MSHTAAHHGIVVGIDGSPSSIRALRWAVAQARLTGEGVDTVTAWQIPAFYGYATAFDADLETLAWQVARETLADVEVPEGVHVAQHVAQGTPAELLLDASHRATLVVMGARGHGEFTGLLIGSASQQVIARARCPVVVIHADHPDHPDHAENVEHPHDEHARHAGR